MDILPRILYVFRASLRCSQVGGLGLPKMELYHKSAQLGRVLDWFCQVHSKLRVSIEDHLSPLPLLSLPWIRPCDRLLFSSFKILVSCFLMTWNHRLLLLRVCSYVGPNSPILGNLAFSPGLCPFLPQMEAGLHLTHCPHTLGREVAPTNVLGRRACPPRAYGFNIFNCGPSVNA